ncbi:hypothetical protein TRIATDRAFT_86532 [Trichoderma atroviride IMI 206040]|uniref:Uncharacterized protein n=1 Tax=Hypocrea atroviridis (strain ATCC 20476 / IMI 206040) TaxID=452589 RepID=G9P1U3_HYPAI|nr:uncharacterized protein TRIATDRAFT_86532 [Trichoderma atroviride IMI 206040]EHK42592.1 hypothetical protein TRIATDRAFT_86532 [Trichoderma atroviride IMI 206040]
MATGDRSMSTLESACGFLFEFEQIHGYRGTQQKLNLLIPLQSVKMSYSKVLTLPNLRDKLRPDVLRRVDGILADLRVEMRPLAKKHQIGAQSTVKMDLHNKKRELAAVEKLIVILHEEYDAGHLDTADEELCLDRCNLDRRFKALTADTVVPGASGQEIGDRVHNDKMSKRSNGSIDKSPYVDEAYMDSLIAPYKTPKGAKSPILAAKDDADADEDQGFEAVDGETMDAFLADSSDDPGAPPTSPLTVESDDSMDDIEIDGEIVIVEEDGEGWENIDDEYKWGDAWVDVDEDVDEYADEDEDRRIRGQRRR